MFINDGSPALSAVEGVAVVYRLRWKTDGSLPNDNEWPCKDDNGNDRLNKFEDDKGRRRYIWEGF